MHYPGSGTGIVGIFLGALLSSHSCRARIYLTDLPEAMPILDQNISLLSHILADQKDAVRTQAQALDWSETPHTTLLPPRGDFPAKFDIILMADVMYNPSTHRILADTMEEFS